MKNNKNTNGISSNFSKKDEKLHIAQNILSKTLNFKVKSEIRKDNRNYIKNKK